MNNYFSYASPTPSQCMYQSLWQMKCLWRWPSLDKMAGSPCWVITTETVRYSTVQTVFAFSTLASKVCDETSLYINLWPLAWVVQYITTQITCELTFVILVLPVIWWTSYCSTWSCKALALSIWSAVIHVSIHDESSA